MKTQEEFITQISTINPNVRIIGNYNGDAKKIHVICKICDHNWYPTPSSLIQGHSCPSCAGNLRYTHERYKQKLAECNPTIELLSKFSSMKERVDVICTNCDFRWQANSRSILHGSGCPKCNKKYRRSFSEFVQDIHFSCPNITIIDETNKIRVNSNLWVKCNKCGYEWNSKVNNLLRGHGCSKCAKNKKKDTKEFISSLKRINDTVQVIGDYKNSKTKIKVLCKRCDHMWDVVPTSLLSGVGCPHCAHVQSSFFEQLLYVTLCHYFGEKNVISRDTLAIGKELDIYIPSKSIAIEYGSWYWHKNKLSNDQDKEKLCIAKRIKCLFVYDAYIDSTDIPIENCMIFSEDLGQKKNIDDAKKAVIKICSFFGLKIIPTENDWINYIAEAKRNAARKSTSDFVEEVSLCNPSIIVLGSYHRDSDKIKVQCRRCNYVWEARAGHLLAGHKCPKCISIPEQGMSFGELYPNLAKEYLQSKNTPSVYELKPYSRKICWWKCLKCENEWQEELGKRVRGGACPLCSRRSTLKRINQVDKTTGEVIASFGSIKEAAAKTNSNSKGISACCCGKSKTSNGYIWKKVENN